MLLVAGGDDQVWPAFTWTENILDRRAEEAASRVSRLRGVLCGGEQDPDARNLTG